MRADQETGDGAPPDELLCARSSGSGWRCNARRVQGRTLCEKHYLQRANKKTRNRSLGTVKAEETNQDYLLQIEHHHHIHNHNGVHKQIKRQKTRASEEVGDGVPSSTPPAEGVPPSTPPAEGVPPSTLPAEGVPPTPAANGVPPSTPPANGVPPSTPSPDGVPPSTPRTDGVPPSTPPADGVPPDELCCLHDSQCNGWRFQGNKVCKKHYNEFQQRSKKKDTGKRKRSRGKSTTETKEDQVQIEDEHIVCGVDKLMVHQDWVGGRCVRPRDKEFEQQKGGLRKETITTLETGWQLKEMVLEASAEDPKYENSSREIADVVQTECTSKGMEIIVTERLSNSEVPTSIETSVSPDNRLASQSNIVINPCSTQVSLFDEVTQKNENLPFVKSYHAWENVDSMKIFHSMPQHPHFQPLQEKNEELRQGLALGYMLSFGTMVNKIRAAQLDEPKSVLENKLNALIELEEVGFNVQLVRARLEELLRVKDSHVQFDEELKEVEGKIVNETHKEGSLKLEVDEVDEKVRELEESIRQMKERRKKLVMEKQTTGSSIVALEERRHEIAGKIQGANVEFTHVAAAPW